MGMDWENERYVRLYTRDTMTWKLIGFEGQAMLGLLFRKLDRAGLIELHEFTDLDGLAMFLDVPHAHLEFAKVGLHRLVERGIIICGDGYFFAPNFLPAQEASSTEAERSRKKRQKDAAIANARRLGVPIRDEAVTERDGLATDRDETVTPASQLSSQPSRTKRAGAGKKKRSSSATLPAGSADGWKPPPGGRADKLAAKRVAAGEIARSDVEACWGKFADTIDLAKPPAELDKIAASWIAGQKPANAKARRTRGEDTQDEDYEWKP